MTSHLNSHLADVNEILLAFHLSQQDWQKIHNAPLLQTKLSEKESLIPKEAFIFQSSLAERMANAIQKSHVHQKIEKIFWTAKGDELARIIGKSIKNNPTDVLLKFLDNSYLGISAKATTGYSDICFRNLGIGRLDTLVGTTMKSIMMEREMQIVNQYQLPKVKKIRKQFLRANFDIGNQVDSEAEILMEALLEHLLFKYREMPNESLKIHLLRDWLCTQELHPHYIKVTGTKNKVMIEDPLENTKMEALQNSSIRLEKAGRFAIIVHTETKRLCKIRIKYESQKLASSIKFTGEP